MDTIERLQEKRQIKLAKEILENAGYKVVSIKESDSLSSKEWFSMAIRKALPITDYISEDEIEDEDNFPYRSILNLLKAEPEEVVLVTEEEVGGDSFFSHYLEPVEGSDVKLKGNVKVLDTERAPNARLKLLEIEGNLCVYSHDDYGFLSLYIKK